ncbi:MAG: 6-phosphogluconolactonase [Paracoccaceae bacterium]
MRLLTYPDRDLLVAAVTDAIATDLTAALRQKDRASLCLPGGTSPAPVFEMLSGVNLDWGRVCCFATDERWLPLDHPRSNAGLIRRHMLKNEAKDTEFIPFFSDMDMPEPAMDGLIAALSPYLPISVLLLGMGADMHIASLFPRGDRLAEAMSAEAPVLIPIRAPEAEEVRVTLSARILRDAMATHVLITGKDKRESLEKAQELPAEIAPIKAVLANATVHWAE